VWGDQDFLWASLSDVCCVAYISRSSLQFVSTRTREVTFSELIVLVMQNLLGTVLSWNPAGVGVEDRRDGWKQYPSIKYLFWTGLVFLSWTYVAVAGYFYTKINKNNPRRFQL